jgi:ketosteroid isomerase-like protein/mannose-6-phosphate isomerase-like protein (cupin superfamily)
MKPKTRIQTLIPLMALAIAAFAPAAAGQTRDERAVRAASDAWQRYVAAQNVDSIVALHTPDATVMPSNVPLMKGSTAIRNGWSEMVKTPGLKLHWIPTRIVVTSATTATEYGTYAESYDTPGGKMRDAGSYVTIWHKVNERWRVAINAPVSTMPMPAQMPAEASDFVARNGSALSWSDFAPPGFPPGGKISVLHGDPFSPGRFVLRLSLPDGYKIPLHWNSTAEYVTVLSGGMQLGMGNGVDMRAAESYSPGDFVFIPPRLPHWAQARGSTVLQVSGNGPFQPSLGVPK